jgi:hypothetical protein
LDLSTPSLIDEYDLAKRVYDDALDEAYTHVATSGEKWPEEKIKLWARTKVRKAGHEDPDTIRWRLRALLGSVLDS